MQSIAVVLAAAQVAAAASYASRPPMSTIEPSLASIQAAAATATPLSSTSNVQGLAFNRFYQLWLENIDYSAASGDANQQALAKQGITLTNYWATTHPSEPNYCAAAGGDYFGMDNDDFIQVPSNVSTIVDLLDTKGISWAEYQEHLPYPGFLGFNFSNQQTYANDYVRKHNPLILFESVTNNATRLSLIKNLTSFTDDLNNKQLPQWAFITPNMTDDAHDTNITFSAKWERDWVTPILNNSYFYNDTLFLLTFDEIETYGLPNKVFAILVGGAIPENLRGTTDNTFYNHYSTISTVSQNWGLPSLGRWDCHANVFQLVANKTGYKNFQVNTQNLYFNSSYPGPLSDKQYSPIWPAPLNDSTCANGKGVLGSIKSAWANTGPTLNYSNPYPYNAQTGNNVGGSVSGGPNATASGIVTASGSASTSASGSASGSASASATSATSKSGAMRDAAPFVGYVAAGALALFAL